MDSRKALSGLCYFSIFFAGFIFPLVVYFASSDLVVKMHAKKSLLSHLIPLIMVPVLVFAIIFEASNTDIPVFTIVTIVVMVLISIMVAIWNIIKGVKALMAE